MIERLRRVVCEVNGAAGLHRTRLLWAVAALTSEGRNSYLPRLALGTKSCPFCGGVV